MTPTRFDILTGFPKLVHSPLHESMIKRAQEFGKAEIVVHDLRDYTHDKHKSIDDTPYGGGAGMVLKPEPVFECMDALSAQREYDEVILTAAGGEKFTQSLANELSLKRNIAIVCGHYKGVDQRVSDALITREVSIGDYVMTGGELAALVMIDTIIRLLPGVVGDSESMLTDSFQSGRLDCPYYTRPPEYRGMRVPDVLLSGDHKKIRQWREEESERRTQERRPDLTGNE
ncbi:MAG: tRNA (guanosine(37)-N1)-methyltransferase TrmD [Ectothiorhodospiraceae bacterium]|nr:tRNA (guanosine(37)-N1)-methyltransferase TrmD [Ectothiorhodospiraceae bacterium]